MLCFSNSRRSWQNKLANILFRRYIYVHLDPNILSTQITLRRLITELRGYLCKFIFLRMQEQRIRKKRNPGGRLLFLLNIIESFILSDTSRILLYPGHICIFKFSHECARTSSTYRQNKATTDHFISLQKEGRFKEKEAEIEDATVTSNEDEPKGGREIFSSRYVPNRCQWRWLKNARCHSLTPFAIRPSPTRMRATGNLHRTSSSDREQTIFQIMVG